MSKKEEEEASDIYKHKLKTKNVCFCFSFYVAGTYFSAIISMFKNCS